MRLWATAAFGLLLSASPAFSQSAELGFGGGVNRFQSIDLGSGYSIDGGFRINFGMTINNWRFFGQDFGYAYNRAQLKQNGQDAGGMAVHQGFYRFVVYATPEGKKVRPFASGGGHFSNFVPPGASATQGGGENKFGLNYGAGVKFRVTETWLVRVDARQYWNSRPFQFLGGSGTIRQTELSVGLAFTL